MSTPSSIAAATLGFRDLIQTALPPGVEVSTQPPAQAEQFFERTGLLARVNLVLYQVSASPGRSNAVPARHSSPAEEEKPSGGLDLLYLVTIYGSASPEEEHSTERLLEATYHAIYQKPILSSADLGSALPGTAGPLPSVMARIVPQSLSCAEVERLFSSMHAVYRPTLAYLVTLSES